MKHKKLLSLSPNLNLENDSHYKVYKEYLDDALNYEQNNHIYNLAITGKYGSGKSSIIDTYFKNDSHVLKVSFSTFEKTPTTVVLQQEDNINVGKELKAGTEKSTQVNSKDLISKGTIFANIINQIIYQVELKNIPLTKFKIKKPLSWFSKSILILEIFCLSSLFLPIDDTTKIIALTMSIMVGILIIWNFLSKVEFQNWKFSFKPVEAEINMKRDDLFERYTDEIVYLFEQSNKSILIIEDLDRFEDLSVFEKLRELNTKLNSKHSKKDQKWTFIYLIKDELFINQTDRVKFFDQIIPVIPFITTNNSFDKMREIFKEDDIDVRLLRILSQFIDDFRLLLNIHNEFEVYTKVASLAQNSENEKGEHNELLALIAYKNIFPNQFDEIQNGEGTLGDVAKKYKSNIQAQIDDANNRLKSLQEKRNSTYLKSEAEYLYIWASNTKLSYSNQYGGQATQSISSLTIAQSVIQNDSYVAKHYAVSNQKYSQFKSDNHEYSENLLPIVAYDSEIQKIRDEIERLNRFQFFNVDGSWDYFKDNELLYALIINRYITLDYLNIINHYYGDSSTQIFMRNIYIYKPDFDINLKLNDISGLVEQLQDSDYQQSQILNIDLACWLFDNNMDKFKLLLNTAYNSETFFVETLINFRPDLYKNVTTIIPSIRFDLSVLKPIEMLDIAKNNRYLESQSNIKLIVVYLKDIISNEQFINFVNDENIYSTFKEMLIQDVNDSIVIEKISDVNHNVLSSVLIHNRLSPTASNINYYVQEFSYDEVIERFIDANRIILDKPLSNDTLLSTISGNSLSKGTFYNLWKTYKGQQLKSDIVSELSNAHILVLIELHILTTDSDLLSLVKDKDLNVRPDFFTNEIKRIIVDNNISLSGELLSKALSLEDDFNDKIFVNNISNLSKTEVVDYLVKSNLSNGRFRRVMQKIDGYQDIVFENEEINSKILSWMTNEEIINNVTVNDQDKLKPTFD
ncbi:hypothetical protein [Leuconostoc mesenteroides]|uniref:YobI family P-loop NTPase n=1 Tax=Leuconostoc mesenteroides TaxID=1245 RepID=UPI0031FEC2A5